MEHLVFMWKSKVIQSKSIHSFIWQIYISHGRDFLGNWSDENYEWIVILFQQWKQEEHISNIYNIGWQFTYLWEVPTSFYAVLRDAYICRN